MVQTSQRSRIKYNLSYDFSYISYDGKDVFLSITTGGGKSICYQAFPVLSEHKNPDCKVLIISPLISIMKELGKERCQELAKLGFAASYIGKSKIDDDSIYSEKVRFVVSSPESLLSVAHWLLNQLIDLLVVEEAHTFILWSEKFEDEAFRKWFGNIGEARCFLSCPIPVITATASKTYHYILMFHSVTPESVKEVIREDMGTMDGFIRVLMASSSAGMGVNFKGIHNVKHYGPQRDMVSFVHQLGRAIRDGDQSFHLPWSARWA
ncbi:ATP-dependent DNA helicase RecQ-like [Haliotis asinina]|uniref:ATP-dependent DNA helicase RecQ-like n=1 Tax=Haliotis asinina TaxID=109174 RepID=UPI00353211B1